VQVDFTEFCQMMLGEGAAEHLGFFSRHEFYSIQAALQSSNIALAITLHICVQCTAACTNTNVEGRVLIQSFDCCVQGVEPACGARISVLQAAAGARAGKYLHQSSVGGVVLLPPVGSKQPFDCGHSCCIPYTASAVTIMQEVPNIYKVGEKKTYNPYG
jgi:hypothetical protein